MKNSVKIKNPNFVAKYILHVYKKTDITFSEQIQ